MSANLSLPYFRDLAGLLVGRGWSVFPQTIERNPASVNGRIIQPINGYALDRRLPTRRALAEWAKYCATENVACIMGEGSGHAIAIDIDVTDKALSHQVTEIAIAILGDTPLRRIGSAPKIALIYREDGQKRVPTKHYTADDKSGHGVDIISGPGQLTFFGLHHRTGNPFKWPLRSPINVGPAELPVISRGMVETFIKRVCEIIPMSSGRDHAGAGLNLGVGFTENGDGKIADGREKWLHMRVTMRAKEWLMEGRQNTREAEAELARQVAGEFIANCVCDGRWEPDRLGSEVARRIAAIMGKYRDGKLTAPRKRLPSSLRHVVDGAPIKNGSPPPQVPGITDARIAPAGERPMPPAEIVECDNGVHLLSRDGHAPVMAKVQQSIDNTITEFMDECNDERVSNKLYILKAPPGVGKTTTLLRRLANDPGTYKDLPGANGKPARMPYVMLVPTYRNIHELRDKAFLFGLDPQISDKQLAGEAARAGVLPAGDAAGLEALRQRVASESGPGRQHGGFKVGVYQGRLRAGCAMHDQMSEAMKAQIGGSALCKKVVTEERAKALDLPDGERTIYCEHYLDCPAIAQAKVFETCHMVLMPHAFLGLSVPQEVKEIRGVIIDERVADMFLHTNKMTVETLFRQRKPGRLSKTERARLEAEAAGRGEQFDLSTHRQEAAAGRYRAAEIAINALRDGVDPAYEIYQTENGQDMIMDALAMCSASMQRDGEVEPNMTTAEVQRVASETTGVDAGLEWRFWNIMKDRCDAIFAAELEHDVRWPDEPFTPPNSLNTGDARIQLLRPEIGGEFIRLSWRTEPNWLSKPTLMLDASAAPAIIAKVWRRNPDEIKEIDLAKDAALYRRIKTILVKHKQAYDTFSNGSIVGEKGGFSQTMMAAERLSNIRNFLATMAVRHGDGRILAAANIPVRRALTECWLPPLNIDFGHFGALRGLDVYKGHTAAISIGRLELPVEIIDGLAAALTYDDETPEPPMDSRGTGYLDDARETPAIAPMQSKTFKRRDGGTVEIESPCYPTRWAAMIQAQYREEELVQFLGRMRPFYREDHKEMPIWYAMSSVLPDGAIIDGEVDVLTGMYPHDGLEIARVTRGTLRHEDAPHEWFWREEDTGGAISEILKRIAETNGAALNGDGGLAHAGSARIRDALDDSIGSDDDRLRREIAIQRGIIGYAGLVMPIDKSTRSRARYKIPGLSRAALANPANQKLLPIAAAYAHLDTLHRKRVGKIDEISSQQEQPDPDRDHEYGEIGEAIVAKDSNGETMSPIS